MTATKDGDGYFQISTGGDQEKLAALTDTAVQKLLNTMQKAIVHLVAQNNDQALSALQACIGELFRRAAECRMQDKKMEISDEYQGDITLQ